MSDAGPFPGGTAVTDLTVYDPPGGSPHLHLACTEGYVVVDGSGRLETLSSKGFQVTRLHAGTVLWFAPGVVHRLVNDGGLRIVVVMQNAGLPEAGDAVMTFPPEYLTDPDRYARAAALADPGSGHAFAVSREAALMRRDLAVQGFETLVARAEDGDLGPLDAFRAAAAALVRARVPRWLEAYDRSTMTAARRTAEALNALQRGDPSYLRDTDLATATAPDEPRLGMCGLLRTYRPTDGGPA